MSIGSFATALGMVALLSLASVSAATAEPITFTYRVDITDRCTEARGCESFPISFPLILSFESEITRTIDEPNHQARFYGSPAFSTLPLALERPPVPAGATQEAATFDSFQPNAFSPGNWLHQAGAQTNASLFTDDFEYFWILKINRLEFLSAAPGVFSPSSFAASLSGGNFEYGYFGHNRDRTEFAPDSIAYLGIAVLLEPPTPIPEPMSLLLVGSGLGYVGARTCRRKTRRPVDAITKRP
jgi:hypothetical protein